MSAPPYMKLYVADYLGDTHHLGALEHGAYLLLLMAMWRSGGSLPAADANLSKLARCTAEEWSAIKGSVLPFFIRSRSRMTHKRLAAEMAKYDVVSRRRSEAGKLGGLKTSSKNNTPGEAIAGLLPTKPEPEPEEETPIAPKGAKPSKSISLRKSDVEAVWAITPATAKERTTRPDIERALKGAAQRGYAPGEVLDGLRAYYASPGATKDGGQFAKGAHRIIQADRWRDFVGQTPLETLAAAPDPLETWRKRVERYLTGSRYWNTNDWGPEPGRPGCEVPPAILAHHNLKQPEAA